MRHDEEHQPPEESAPEEPVPNKPPRRASARPSMRRELLELFRDTRSDTPRPAPDDDAPPGPTGEGGHRAAAPEPSRFLRRFLQRSAPAFEPARSGLVQLDGHLGGGFSQGLHLVVGDRTEDTTAFLESLAWEAVSTRRPTLYYALRNGSLQVWERLITTLGTLTQGHCVVPAALRSLETIPTDREALLKLDAELQTSVLPYLSLFDRPAGPPGNLSAFIDRIHSRALETAEQHGRLPLVLVDDLEELAALTGSRSPSHLLARLDAALAADSLPGVLSAGPSPSLVAGVSHLPVQTLLSLRAAERPDAGSGRLELGVLKNAATGWTGDLELLLDPASGLFAEVARAG